MTERWLRDACRRACELPAWWWGVAFSVVLLFEAMLRAGQLSYGEIRDRESGRLQTLTYAALLWQLFRALIE